MDDRKKSLSLAAVLAIAPAVLVFPALALARFETTGPQRVWTIVFYAPLAMWMEARAFRLLLQTYRHRRDPFLLAILPLGVLALCTYFLHGVLFLLNLPAFLYRFI
jgi:hypothetical protein